MPAVFASWRAGLRAFESFGLKTIGSRMSESWPAASVLRWIVVSSETWPDAAACALAVQTCSSRKPLPTPPAFEYPILYILAGVDAWALGAPALGAVDAPVEHAAATARMAATPTTSRARADALIIRFLLL